MKFELAELPYDYDGLEPYISAKVLKLHYDKHYRAYVNGANAAYLQLLEANENKDFSKINQISKNLAFNIGGSFNHKYYFSCLSESKDKQEPIGDFKQALLDQFGSIDSFKNIFTAIATGIQGSGWAVCGLDSQTNKLILLGQNDHQVNFPAGLSPILLLDVWEHAYYLDYLNDRSAYINAWFSLLNWTYANKQYCQHLKNNIK